ncbi:hypothetical protein Tco_1076808 [Tanacetum coccineum]
MVMQVQKHVMMQDSPDARFKPLGEEEKMDTEDPGNESEGPADLLFSQNSKDSPYAGFKPLGEEEKIYTKDPGNESEASGKDSEVPSIEDPREDQRVNQELDASINSTNNINTASNGNNTNNVNDVSSTVNAAGI